MKKMWKAFFTSLLIVAVVIVPACRTKKKNVTPQVTPQTETGSTVPDVGLPPVSDTATRVDTQPPDFVADTPTEEVLPRDAEELNRVAQAKGYIRDAFFNYDEFTLDADAQAALTASATWLRSHPEYTLLVEGHCDERGTEQYNLALGDRRANIVREFLMTLGVDASRLRTVSYGEERPFEEGHDESSWAQNRRGHLVLVGR
ncbi:MAG TPA: peptidoglycan-associated lipoprotein Pal [Thermoanaerobaculia bacterium]|jgi:peptidoglycan-associated lipoprotein